MSKAQDCPKHLYESLPCRVCAAEETQDVKHTVTVLELAQEIGWADGYDEPFESYLLEADNMITDILRRRPNVV